MNALYSEFIALNKYSSVVRRKPLKIVAGGTTPSSCCICEICITLGNYDLESCQVLPLKELEIYESLMIIDCEIERIATDLSNREELVHGN
ncbi:hypothetical protein DASC09_003330 [Saccharomycopsis crataegensis]|uniref:Uncharacterized protein n=1 Tax=Saccharomycopsis crataegensis TaxID=43959 RepID=A0AAV5QE27_9ASCO|nr:hypothetical protein DASC09_003330 [Saccharomycopsis crataegensis]